MRRSQAACDKSRNEQQKSVLLKVLSETKHHRRYEQLREECKRIVEKSRRVCERARELIEQTEASRAKTSGKKSGEKK